MKGSNILAIDVGGTFTDLAQIDSDGQARTYKVLTTPKDPSIGVFRGLELASIQQGLAVAEFVKKIDIMVYSTTLATNAVITGNLARVALITTKGMRDVLEMRRGGKERIYDLKYQPPPPLVTRDLRRTVEERIDSQGRILTPLRDNEVKGVLKYLTARRVEALAVCFMHSYANDVHERRAGEIVRELWSEGYLTVSSELLPEIGLYERTSTTILNSAVGPLMKSGIDALESKLAELGSGGALLFMQSNAGMMASPVAKRSPVRTLLSGPAAGATAAGFYSSLFGKAKSLSLDMGGTTCLLALSIDRAPSFTTEGEIQRYRVAVPMVDVVTIGSGGGSIAWIDKSGLLRVGPQSAAADPGPACYGLGGVESTVTDADLQLGYIDPNLFLGGRMKLSKELAEVAISKVADHLGLDIVEAAHGIFTVVNSNMSAAVRESTIGKGYDPRDFWMVAGGGAGPIHALSIAEELQIPAVIVLRESGSYTAMGILLSDIKHDFVRTHRARLSTLDLELVQRLYEEMQSEADATLDREGVPKERRRMLRFIDLRYVGQFHQLTIELGSDHLRQAIEMAPQHYNAKHDQLYGYSVPEDPIEALNLRLTAVGLVERRGLMESPLEGEDAGHARMDDQEIYMKESGGMVKTRIYDALRLKPGNLVEGPAVVRHPNSSIVVNGSYELGCDRYGNFLVFTAARSDEFRQYLR